MPTFRGVTSLKLLKTIDPQILVALSTLINKSFETGVFHDKIKIAKAMPVFKKGPSNIKSNNPINFPTFYFQ